MGDTWYTIGPLENGSEIQAVAGSIESLGVLAWKIDSSFHVSETVNVSGVSISDDHPFTMYGINKCGATSANLRIDTCTGNSLANMDHFIISNFPGSNSDQIMQMISMLIIFCKKLDQYKSKLWIVYLGSLPRKILKRNSHLRKKERIFSPKSSFYTKLSNIIEKKD